MTEDPWKVPAPRTLRGRRARKLWSQLAPVCAQNGTLNAGSAQLLQVLCVLLANIGEDPDAVNSADLGQARALSRSFRILR